MDWYDMKDIEDPIARKVCQRIADRSQAGTKKFGNTMDQAEKDLEEMFVDTLEELGDAMIYLEKGLQILRKKKTLWTIKN